MPLSFALATVRDAPFIVDVLYAADDLALEAMRSGGPRAVRQLRAVIDDLDDELMAIAAVHAIGRVFDDSADAVLSDLLSDPRPFLREHAAWTLSSRLPRLDAIGRLIAVVAGGGFPGMLAQRTLQHWSRSAADHVALALEGALTGADEQSSRARLVETLGLVPGDLAGRAVLRIAADTGEGSAVRAAAVAALGDITSKADPTPNADVIEAVTRIGRGDDELAAVARLAEVDLRPGRAVPDQPSRGAIAQLFLHADLDRELSRAGTGDNGGVATLLVRLGDALSAEPQIKRVLTLSRSTAQATESALRGLDGLNGHVLAGVPLPQPPVPSALAWPSRVAAERGIRRALRIYSPIDALHLRMADVGSMAGAQVALELGIPVVFTLAPDPHAVLHSLDMTGSLTRSNFGRTDQNEHYWFRARLVQRLAANAAHNVLFPRPELDHDLHELLGVDRAAEPHRYTVVPEGIDLAVSDRAQAEVARGAPMLAVRDLADLVGALDPERHGLPLAISVGRLHRVKGMVSVVQAWATDPDLRARCNLLIVGGDLAHPSDDERGQLDLIATVIADLPDGAGLILAGHRSNDVVARWLAAVQLGLEDMVGPGGVYVCGSLKEEFGLAILEAMAAGLVVVAPAGGGPATYVEQGVTGLLVDTRSPVAIGAGMHAALDLAVAPGSEQRACTTQAFVRDHYTVQAMASALAGVYAAVRMRAQRANQAW